MAPIEKTDVPKNVRLAEELAKFSFFAKNKDLSRAELCGGIISDTVYINGEIYVILTSLTEADVTRFREETVFDFI